MAIRRCVHQNALRDAHATHTNNAKLAHASARIKFIQLLTSKVADVTGGHCDIIFCVVKNDGLKIGYKMAHKMKTRHYFVEIFVKSPY